MDSEEWLALIGEGLDPDDPAVMTALDMVRWELQLLGTATSRPLSGIGMSRACGRTSELLSGDCPGCRGASKQESTLIKSQQELIAAPIAGLKARWD